MQGVSVEHVKRKVFTESQSCEERACLWIGWWKRQWEEPGTEIWSICRICRSRIDINQFWTSQLHVELPEVRFSERFMIAGCLAFPLPGTLPKIKSAWGTVCTVLVLYRTVSIENWELQLYHFWYISVHLREICWTNHLGDFFPT